MNRQIPLGTVCLLLAVMACQVGCSNSPEVEAVIRIDRFPMFGEKLTTRDYDIYRETQAALLKSKFVLTGALRPHSDLHRDISQLPMVQTREQPVDWLENAIQFEVVPNSELIRVKMSLARSTSESELEQTEKVLNAVVSAYLSEIVNKERLQQLMMLNTLRKRYQTNYENIKRKSDEVDKLKAQLGQAMSSLGLLTL